VTLHKEFLLKLPFSCFRWLWSMFGDSFKVQPCHKRSEGEFCEFLLGDALLY
jgi:hypothetical protein